MPFEAGELRLAEEILLYSRQLNLGMSFDDVLLEPDYSDIESRSEVDLSTWITKYRQLKIPIVAANMDTICESKMAIAMGNLGGLGVIHRYMSYEKQIEEVKKTYDELEVLFAPRGMPPVAAAIGVKNGIVDHVKNLVEAGCSIIVIDVAHGYHILVCDALAQIANLNLVAKDGLPLDIIAGNIALPPAVPMLENAGATALKVGVGPGRVCTTRKVTGHGLPQLTAVAACSLAGRSFNIPIIADGGIKESGDIVKALAAGASTVMCGSIFAGTLETPGDVICPEGPGPHQPFKIYRGMSSREAQTQYYGNDPDAPEGINIEVPARGSVEDVVRQLVAGIRSGLSYSGARNIKELQKRASWIRLTDAAKEESKL